MCGIAGLIASVPERRRGQLDDLVGRMTAALVHRGPDAGGVWCDEGHGVVLGHRRLSIIDLSPHGAQPMISADGRYVIVFNGEIYNFQELCKKLIARGHRFRGHSDTEVALTAVQEWGFAAALSHLVGMFALAVWDRHEQLLHLARDRLGEKPLYYGWVDDCFAFASELRALRALPFWDGQLDQTALHLYFRHNYIPTPYSAFTNIRKLEPGTYLSLSRATLAQRNVPKPDVYWSLHEYIRRLERGRAAALYQATAIEGLDNVLRHVVRQMLVADVPLGAFLSGGLDSSLVVALMQAESASRVKTFSIGFNEAGYNEAEAAKRVASYLGTDHSEFYLSAGDAAALVPSILAAYDEPFADSSQIPTLLICQLARRRVTVALAGDGGDEAFGGYARYRTIDRAWCIANRCPIQVRRAASRLLGWANGIGYLGNVRRVERLQDLLLADDIRDMYGAVMSYWRVPEELVGGKDPAAGYWKGMELPSQLSLVEQLMYVDAITYLPDDLLVKIDRASMHVSLEMRLPFTDQRVIEYAWTLPRVYKTRKWILRELLKRYVPKVLVDRPKMGFRVPLDEWLRGSLRDWVEALIAEERLKREGLLRPEPIRQRWAEHLSGRRNWGAELWSVLVFQGWIEGYRNR